MFGKICNVVAIIALIYSVFNYNLTVQSRELSILPHRVIRDSLQASSSNLKKLFVDFETDVVSAFSPLSISGTRYPWRILGPEIAQAQHKAIAESEADNSINPRRSDIGLFPKRPKLLSSNLNSVNFYIYQDHKNLDNYKTIDMNKDPISQKISAVGENNQVKIIIHGFQSGPTLPFAQGIKNAYLQETNHTVIITDWEDLSLPKSPITILLYPAVTANAQLVGEKAARLIEYLLENEVVTDLNQIHVIGHSLGAHAAGNAGMIIGAKYDKKIGRITALDAAFLAFIGSNTKHRIDKHDAKFVDSIHTSGLGTYDPVGHVDFYPNGGRNQVSCYNREQYDGSGRGDENFSRAFEKIIQSCSHARSYHYFINTINPNYTYVGCKCISWKDYRLFCKDSCGHRAQMGEYVSPTARGKYFLEIP